MTIIDDGVIDQIAVEKSTHAVLLFAFDHMPWKEPNGDHILLWQSKIQNYLTAVETGQLARAYPDALGRPIVFVAVCKHYPAGELPAYFFQRLISTVEDAGISWRFADLPDCEPAPLPPPEKQPLPCFIDKPFDSRRDDFPASRAFVDSETDAFVLPFFDAAPWGEPNAAHLESVKNEVNFLLNYILDGRLSERHAEAEGRQIEIRGVFSHAPAGEWPLVFFRTIHQALNSRGILWSARAEGGNATL